MKLTGKKIIISGGSGYLAQWLGRYFSEENEVIFLSRMKVRDKNNRISKGSTSMADSIGCRTLFWDGRTLDESWLAALEGADLLLNLAGRSVNDRYRPGVRKEILESRIHSTAVLAEALARCKKPPGVWMNASSATIYRHSPDQSQDEYRGEISRQRTENMPANFINSLRNLLRRFRASFRSADRPTWDRPHEFDFSVEVCRQ